MNAAQVIGSWWVKFSRSLVGQFRLLVCVALGLGEHNSEQSERRLAVAAQQRTRGVGRAGAPGARKAGTIGDDSAESSNGGAMAAPCVTDLSGAHNAGVKRSGTRDCIRGGLLALTPQGEPTASQSEGSCGPSDQSVLSKKL